MAVQYIGNAYTLSDQNTGSTSITVPSGANYCIIGLHFWMNNTNTTCTLTLNDVTASAIELVPLAYDEESVYMYGVPIAESGSKTFTWSWTNSPDIGDGVGYTFMFFSGVDQSDPIRDSAYDHHTDNNGPTLTTPEINTDESDLVAILTTDYSGSGSLVGYDQTVILSGTANGSKYNAGTKAGVSGTITATGAVVSGGIIAASLQGIVMDPTISDCTDPISDEELATVTGQYFSESGNTLEFGNSSTYSACTVLVEATITAESASEITATVNQGSLTAGTVYAYVTNSDNLTNAIGYSTELQEAGNTVVVSSDVLSGTNISEMDVPSLSEYSLSSFQIQEIAVDNILNGNISLSSFSIPEIDVGKFTLTPDILRTIRIKDSKSSTLSLNRKLAVWRTQ